MSVVNLQFLGAAQTVTGSKYLLSVGDKKVLIDCGLFQGLKELRLKNRAPFPIPPSEINAIILTHAHIDHSGYIPLLVKNGFKGPIYCTHATKDLCGLLLPDSGHLQEEEANYLNKHHFSKHDPALPLYTKENAERSLLSLKAVNWLEDHRLTSEIEFRFCPAGHLLGAASVRVKVAGKTIVFSGDLGRKNDVLLVDPTTNLDCETLIMESTYGDRVHSKDNPEIVIGELIREVVRQKGVLLIPSFAVGRAQLILYYIHQLKLKKLIPDIPVYLNSPMASKASDLFIKYNSELKVPPSQISEICNTAQVIQSVEESIKLNEKNDDPKIIIAASGMATGGRVIHHLKAFAPDPRNTILFAGFQAVGTRGEALVNGAKKIRIHGQFWPVNAKVVKLDSLSAHADSEELLSWVRSFKIAPKRIFLTHGEPRAAEALAKKIRDELGIEVSTPSLEEIVRLP